MSLAVGDKAPAFSLINQSNEEVRLSDFVGKNIVLLAFYPGDFTKVCTSEMVCFRQDFSEFNNLDCIILGISTDSVASHADFKKQFHLPFDLLSDENALVSEKYGTKLPLINKSNRAIFIINKAGIITYAHREKLPVFKRTNQELIIAIKKSKN